VLNISESEDKPDGDNKKQKYSELTYREKLKLFFKMPFTVYVYDHVFY
jgi:hypothetical protein